LRLLWAFAGGAHSRWSSILPVGPGYRAELRQFLSDLRAGRPRHYVGHNPVGRIAVTVLLALLLTQAVTGLILAGTDLFYPPLGSWIAQSVAAPGVDPATLVPYAPAMYDAEAHAAMRLWRGPIVAVHEAGFYALLVVAALHVLGVVATELRERGNLVSAMFSGQKILKGPPVDRP
jgi:Ni/Fe-hydrogenase 1 B-type cytochrome subunit